MVIEAVSPIEASTGSGPTPDQMFQIATGYWASKALFTGLDLGVFDALGSGPLTIEQAAERVDLPTESLERLLIALTALGLLQRKGNVFTNASTTQAHLVKGSPAYIAGMFGHFNHDLYPLWRFLPDAIREQRARWRQAFGPDASDNPFESMYADPAALRGFMAAMDGMVGPVAHALVDEFDFTSYQHLLDIGGAWGTVPIAVLRRYPNLRATIFDLPPVEPVAREHLAEVGLADRVEVRSGDMFADPLPTGADLIVLGWILHDWDDAHCVQLLRRCYAALPPNGAVLLLEMTLDDDRTGPLPTALMSLNMLVATVGGKERSGAEYQQLLSQAGFSRSEVHKLHAPRDYILGYKDA
jgi:3-hydroxy-5-methyl-1-naphthoate 3-O-methyltransferase